MLAMPSLSQETTQAANREAMPVWDIGADSSVLQNDTAWLLSFIDILTLLLTLFVLLLAYDHNAEPVSAAALVAPREQAVDRQAPTRTSLETVWQDAMPLLLADWYSLLEPRQMASADSIEALAPLHEPQDHGSVAVQNPVPAPSAPTYPNDIVQAAADTGSLFEPAAAQALLPPLAASPLPEPAEPAMSPLGEPAMSPLAEPAALAAAPAVTLVPPGALAVLELLPDSASAPRETTAAAILMEQFSEALRERIDVSVASGVVNLEISDNILFTPGSATLTPAGQALLDELAPALRDPSGVLSVEGHTDNVPIRTALFPSNWELSSARAAMVTRSLIERGVAADRIRAIGYGDTRPRADNGTAEGRARNRRVSFVLQLD